MSDNDPFAYDNTVLTDIKNQQSAMLQSIAQFQLDFGDILEDYELTLRGQVKDANNKVIQKYMPLMNKNGINHFMSKMRSIQTKVTAQSYFTDSNIKSWMWLFAQEIIDDIAYESDGWNLAADNYTNLLNNTLYVIEAMMLCARNGRLSDLVGKISKVVETHTLPSMEQQRKIRL